MPPRVPNGMPVEALVLRGVARARGRWLRPATSSSRPPSARRAPPPSRTTRAASARSSASRRCCRSRCAESSGGSSVVTSISQIEQVADGVGVLGAVQPVQDDRRPDWPRRGARDRSRASSQSRSPSYSASGGRGTSGGGITPARSLRITFSHSSAWSPTAARSSPCSDRFAVLTRSLWQVTQYLIDERLLLLDRPPARSCGSGQRRGRPARAAPTGRRARTDRRDGGRARTEDRDARCGRSGGTTWTHSSSTKPAIRHTRPPAPPGA